MDYAKTAEALLKALGNEENIKTVTHCMTRMRFVLYDETIPKDETVKSIPGVLGVARQSGQYQVIIGNDVPICYREFMKLGAFGSGAGMEKEQPVHRKVTLKTIVNGIIDAISGSIAPILPMIIGCGMIRLLGTILQLFGVSDTLPTFQIIQIIGDAGFYFLPIILAASAAAKFGCSPGLAMALTAVLVHPNLIGMFAQGNTSFLRLPVTATTYSSTVVPALLTTWLLSKTEPFFDRVMKGWVKTIFKPTLILLIGVPLMLVVAAPAGAFVGNGLAYSMAWMQETMGGVTLMLLSALTPLIVMAGIHYALVPSCLTNLGTIGFDTILGPIMLASNLAQASAAAMVAWRTRNKDLKALATTSSVSAAVAGITEPALYGVTLRLKKPFIASMIGAGAAGLFAGIVGLRNYALVTPALVSMVQFISPDIPQNIFYAGITAVISVVVTAVMTLVLGWEDPEEAPDTEEAADTEKASDTEKDDREEAEKIPQDTFTSPLEGTLIPLSQVKDETFASGVLGQGVAVVPDKNEVYAPCDGTVTMIFDTKHAIGFKADSGMEMIIHIGLDTVQLNGKGFEPVVAAGQKVKRGELLLRFDRKLLMDEGYDITTPVIVADMQPFQRLELLAESGNADKSTRIIRGMNQEEDK